MAEHDDEAKGTALGRAEYPDYEFLDKTLDGYPPGTTFEIDGEPVNISKLDDPFAASPPRSG